MKRLLIVVALALIAAVAFAPMRRYIINSYNAAIQTADDRSRYETLKAVEDTCRAMIASYNTDRLTYEQYKYSDNDERRGWAEQAKMRANKTASTYNNYILQNQYVWKAAVPGDIDMELGYLE